MNEAWLTSQLVHWRSALAGAPEVLSLPTDRPRRSVQRFCGARYSFALPSESTDGLNALSRREGVTLFMTLLAAFQTLLARYTGQDDIVVGSPVANRTRVETEHLIGFFANTLVLRTKLDGDPTFLELLARVREVALNAYAHQDLPFEKLVEELQPTRSLKLSPLFQVMFVFQNAPSIVARAKCLTLTRLPVQTGTTKFDLTLSMTESEGRLQSTFEYNTDLFDHGTIRRMAAHLGVLLEGIAANPSRPISSLPVLPQAERHRLLVQWNNTSADYPRQRCLHELFENQALAHPDALAILAGVERYTYGDLNKSANAIAHRLQSLGVGPETVVGVVLRRSPTMVAAMLGILKAGGAYLAIDPSYPLERVHFMLRDAGTQVVVTDRMHAQLICDSMLPILCVDDEFALTAALHEPISTVSSEQPAYVIYTSGSTGAPKGVVALHRAAVNRFHWMWRQYPFEKDEICCQKTSIGFVDSVWEIFGPLLQSVPLVMVPDEVVRDPQRLISLLADQQITRIVLVPSLLRAILQLDEDLDARLPRLKYWTVSGESLPSELVRSFQTRLAQRVLLNLYGSSEVAADVTCYQVPEGFNDPVVPVGRPIANTQVYVLDKERNSVPTGVAGELFVGGDGLARGYVGQPLLTAEKFVANPFSDHDARLYRTGDLARYRADGALELLGRLDDQLKVRGVRIEPGEVEVVLATHPAVKQTAVIARDDHLVAYIVARAGAVLTGSELKRFAQVRLPEYAVPDTVINIDALPLTASGKIARRSLPAPERAHLTPASVCGPRTMTEARLADLWADTLGLARVGIHDNFFDLGGHSLLAVRLFAAVERTFVRKLPLSALFEAPTVAQFAELLERPTTRNPSLVPIQVSGRRPPFFCVHAVDGEVLVFGQLARHLGSDQPFYALHPGELEAGAQGPVSVESLAAHYLNEIMTVAPDGPFLLGGYSSGGNVAYEMARQLSGQQHNVGLVALFDTSAFYTRGFGVAQRIIGYVNEQRLGPGARLRFVRAVQAARQYVPKPYNGRVDLFRAEQHASLSPDLGWRKLALGGVEIHTVPGDHLSIIREPHVRLLAAGLRTVIDSVINGVTQSI